MNFKAVILIVLCASQLAACTSLGRSARVDPVVIAGRASTSESSSTYAVADCPPVVAPIKGDQFLAINLDCFKFNDDDEETAYELATYRSDEDGDGDFLPEDVRQFRNRLGFILIAQADGVCEQEKGRIYANRAAAAGLLDFLSAGFSISSTIVTGDQASSILSGIAGLSTATRNNVDANIYQNQLVSAITKVMDAERFEILRTIRAKQSESVADFTADEMIVLANQYHQACSFQKGIQLLLDAAVNKEGVDLIVKAINLRSTITELERGRTLLISIDTDEARAEEAEIAKLIGEATRELYQIGQGATGVSVGATDSTQ